MYTRLARRFSLVLILVLVSLPIDALAQAWVGYGREGDFGLDYSFITSDSIAEEDDGDSTTPDSFDGYPIDNHNIVLNASYNPIDNLGVTVAVPFVIVRYTEDEALLPAHGEYDDGDYHSTFQDLRARVRYQLPFGAPTVAFTPHLGVQIPLADYEVFGFANVGRHLKGVLAGGSLGLLFFNRLYAHAFYELGLFERFKDDEISTYEEFNQHKSDLNTQVGYFILPGLEAHLALELHWSHGGVGYLNLPEDASDPLFLNHDPIIDEDWILGGGGLSWYVIEDKVRLSAEFRLNLAAYNAREVTSLTLGASYDFSL
jgi:hypothetical protein